MADSAKRPRKTRRRLDYSRRGREPVEATGSRDFDPPGGPDGEGWDEGGSAGVREPRRPTPLGPMSGAGELPVPEPPQMIVLADPRR